MKKAPHTLPLKLISTLLIAGLASCSSPASQCKQFADVTLQYGEMRDSFATSIKSSQVSISGAQNLKDVHTAAAEYTRTVDATTSSIDAMLKDLGALSIVDPQLDEYRKSYVINLTASKTALASAGSAMQLMVDAKTEEAMRDSFYTYKTKENQSYDSILAADAEESAIVEQVNAYCAQPPE